MALATTSVQFRKYVLRRLPQLLQLTQPKHCQLPRSLGPSPVQHQPCAHLSTSKKDRDSIAGEFPSTSTATTPPPGTENTKTYKPDPTTVTGTKKYWRPYGFNYDDPETDKNDKNFIMFMTITIGTVLASFMIAYWPDSKLRDWSQREGYIELARREALGLPLVDPNLVPPENINLPTDEELGDYNIII